MAAPTANSNRCERCGRRFGVSSYRASGAYAPITTATAPAFDPFWAPHEVPETIYRPEPQRPEAARVVYQKSLFDSAVVQLPMPVHMAGNGRKPPKTARRARSRYMNESQQAFAFDDNNDAPPQFETGEYPVYQPSGLHTVESVPASQFDERLYLMRPHGGIYCDAPVAQPVHRIMAGALDFSMVMISLVLFLATFYILGGRLAITPAAGLLCAAVYAVLWFLYKAVYSICGADTPGMIWTDLKLVSFEGTQPDREQRIYRMFGGVLGFLSAGLGLVWSLVDEEQLTWHDHISKTFPSPQRS